MRFFIKLFIIYFFAMSCSKSENATLYQPVDQEVSADLNRMPYQKLSDYNFFINNISTLSPNNRVLPYKPQSELFTDDASKKRFVWLPKNTIAAFINDHQVLDLPEGAVLIKNFYYENVAPLSTKKIIETRLMIKKNNQWIFAEYIWNNDQTDALLTTASANKNITYTKNGITNNIDYQIPDLVKCVTCHTLDNTITPIGIKPQNLNFDLIYADNTRNQLQKWVDVGYLQSGFATNINSVVNYNDVSQNLTTRVRSYFDSQCGHCHQVGGNGGLTVDLRYTFNETASNMTNMGVCVTSPTTFPGINRGKIINPQNVSQSTLIYAINTNNSLYRMPRIGRTIVDQDGLALVEQWINALPACQ